MADDRLEDVVRAIVARNRREPFRLFVFGKIGAGKSSLVNTLLNVNREVAKEGGGLRSQTKKVEAYAGDTSLKMLQTTVNDVPVVLWDSPGLNDPYTNGEETLKTIKSNCQDVDLFVYCIQITQSRMGRDDFDSIAELTNMLGKGVWKQALFALTFANQLRPRKNSSDRAKMLKDRVSEWKELLQDAVERAGLSRDDAAEIPVVPTSYRQTSLPGVANWYNDFWITGLSRTKDWSKFIAMLQITKKTWIQDQGADKVVAVEVKRRVETDCSPAYYEEDKKFQSLAAGRDPLTTTRIVTQTLRVHVGDNSFRYQACYIIFLLLWVLPLIISLLYLCYTNLL